MLRMNQLQYQTEDPETVIGQSMYSDWSVELTLIGCDTWIYLKRSLKFSDWSTILARVSYTRHSLSMLLVLWQISCSSYPLTSVVSISSLVPIYSTVGVLVPGHHLISHVYKDDLVLPICLLRTCLNISAVSFLASNSILARFLSRAGIS